MGGAGSRWGELKRMGVRRGSLYISQEQGLALIYICMPGAWPGPGHHRTTCTLVQVVFLQGHPAKGSQVGDKIQPSPMPCLSARGF